MSLSMGVRMKFFQEGQSRNFAYPFQVADDAMQIDIHKTLYPFYTTKNASYYGNNPTNALR